MADEVDHTVAQSDWTGRDEDIVVQYLMFKKLGLENADEIGARPD